MKLEHIPIGTLVHNVEIEPGKGGVLGRSAGNKISVAGKENGLAKLLLPSGEMRMVPMICKATVGTLSNPEHFNQSLSKAGRNRFYGIRPTVRGVAMNPVDHHNGGRTHGGKILSSLNGKVRKGKITRDRNKPSQKKILMRRP